MNRKEIKPVHFHGLIEIEGREKAEKPMSLWPGLTPMQDAMLNERMDRYEKGLVEFSSWEEVRVRIVS